MNRARVTLAGIVVVFLAFAAGLTAQDRLFGWTLFADRTLTDNPCASHQGIQGSVQPFYYDHQALLFYTCGDGLVVLRTYYNPQDNSREPSAVYTIPNPTPPSVICPSGFVNTQDGKGCVPPNHPMAKH